MGEIILDRDTKVIIHRGENEIGGTIIEIRTRDEAIILEFGISYSRRKKFYDPLYRRPRGVEELIRLGIVPPREGLYTIWRDDGEYNENPETDVIGAFISHAHTDHIGLLAHINGNIPVYLGHAANLINNVYLEKSRRERYSLKRREDIEIETFRTGDVISVGSFRVRPIHVDHSIPGAYSFLVETPGGLILYTGDFRLHGNNYRLTQDMVATAESEDVELMITEGTRVHGGTNMDEERVYREIMKIMDSYHGEVLVESNARDYDRYVSILRAAAETGRKVVMTDEHLIYFVRGMYRDHKLRRSLERDIGDPRDLVQGLVPGGVEKRRRDKKKDVLEKIMDDDGFTVVGEYNYDRDNVLLGFYRIVQDIYDKGGERIAIISNSEPFDEEGETDEARLRNWLTVMGAPSYRVHCSGHISMLDLKKIVERIEPRRLKVVHSEYPELVARFLGIGEG